MSNLFKNFKSPIAAQIRSEKAQFTARTITGYDRIPFFGIDAATSDATLKVIRNLCSLSPSFQSAMKDKGDSIFSNGVNVIQKPVSGLASFEIQALPIAGQIEFLQKLKQLGFDCNKMFDVFKCLMFDIEQIGNAFLEITHVDIDGGTGSFSFKYIPFEMIGYKSENKNVPSSLKTFLVSPFFGSYGCATIAKEDIEETNATQMYGTINFRGGRTKRTILHIRNETGTFYGEAKNIISILEWLSTEYNIADKVSKISVTDTVTKDVFIFKKPDNIQFENKEQAELYRKMRRKAFEDVTTNRGDEPKTLAVLEVTEPKEFQHISIPVHRNAEEDKRVLELCKEKIYGALTMSPRLNGGTSQQSNLGGNANANESDIMQKTINATASLFSNVVDRIFEIMHEVVNDESLINNSFRFVTANDVIEKKKIILNDTAIIDTARGN